jgi:hypothetical protein
MGNYERWMFLTAAAAVAVAACASTGTSTGGPQEGKLAANAPADRPVDFEGTSPDEVQAKSRKLIAPYVAQAMATYPDAKARYLRGLPPGENFFVTVILRDRDGRFEQVFLIVERIEKGLVTGRIASNILTVRGFKRDDQHRVYEGDLVDWLITKPDGSEEGNVVGKFLDTLPQTIK